MKTRPFTRSGLSMLQYWKLTMMVFIFLLSVQRASEFKVSPRDYCYTENNCNPPRWVKTYPSCGVTNTTLHSPISLRPELTKNISVAPLELHGFGKRQKSWTVANVRDTVVVEFKEGMMVKGGGLKHEYWIVEMRFHWGSTTGNGSEHTLGKRRFPMEMQIVGVASGFVDFVAASSETSGLLMMGIFIDIAGDVNKHFKVISDAIAHVPYPGDWVTVAPPALSHLIPVNGNKFYRYQGGQTTPPCNQAVDWIVFEEPIFISKDQGCLYKCRRTDSFRAVLFLFQYSPFTDRLYYSDKNDVQQKPLVENYRTVQPSLDRPVFVSSAVTFHPAKGGAPGQHPLFPPLPILIGILSFNVA